MSPELLDYYLVLASTVDPAHAQAARDALIALVAAVRDCQAENARLRALLAEHGRACRDTDPAPVPPDERTTRKVERLSGSLGSSLEWGDDDDGDAG